STPYILCASALIALAGFLFAQEQGPITNNGGATVAKPKKAGDTTAPDETLPKLPSQYSKKDRPDLTTLPSFKTEVDVVTLDASVIDSKGTFLPGIPETAFRVLEDNVPQKITKVAMGEAPITLAMVIEFSSVFQQM